MFALLKFSHSSLAASLLNETTEWVFLRFRTGIDSPFRPNAVTSGVCKKLHSLRVVGRKGVPIER